MMRSEEAMADLILTTAQRDDRVRAVILNGSRANPQARRDIFQDFDIVYVVTEIASFKADPDWIRCFGEMLILQLPDDMRDPATDNDASNDADNEVNIDVNIGTHEVESYAYLMQFADGNRIDLTLYPVAQLATMERDSLSVLWLDKDNLIAPFPPPHEGDYLPTPPTAKAFADCCNEFWWVSAYVAKGLWREEITYAHTMMDQYVRTQLMKMLAWQIGIQTQFTANPGKEGKYFQQHLSPATWAELLQTYADADYAHTWDALETMCGLFRKTALTVAAHLGFRYRHDEDEKVTAHLAHVRSLPKDAARIY